MLILIFFLTFFIQFALLHGIPVINNGELYIVLQVSKGLDLYTEIFSHHGPAMPYLIGTIFKFLPPTPLFIEFMSYAVYSLIAVFIYKIARTCLTKTQSIFTPFIFIIISRIFDAHLFYPDSYGILFATIGIYMYITNSPIKSGISFGISALFKQNIGVYAFAAVIIYDICTTRKLKTTLQTFLSFLIPISVTTLYFYFNGTFADMYYGLISFNLNEASKMYNVPCSPSSPVVFVLLISIISFIVTKNNTIRLISIWSIFSSAVMYPLCYNQHLISAIAPFSILIISIIPKKITKKTMLICLILLLIPLSTFSIDLYREYGNIKELKSTPADPWYSWVDYSQSPSIQYIKSHSNQSDMVFTIPNDFSVYIESGLESIPYWQVNPLTYQPHFQDKVINSLEQNKVKYVLMPKKMSGYICQQPIYDYLSHNYHATDFEDFILLTRGSSVNITQCQENNTIKSVKLINNNIILEFNEQTQPPLGFYMEKAITIWNYLF